MSPSRHVDVARLWRRHMEMAAIGALSRGGVNRPALSPLDADARRRLVGWGRALGLEPFQDTMGNLFLRRAGDEPGAAPVMTGSHLDTQPTGGKFDGPYGVLAGLEALESMHEAGRPTRSAAPPSGAGWEAISRTLPETWNPPMTTSCRSP